MPLTDYISPELLRNEGYIYQGNSDEMLNSIDKDYLRSRGWFDLSALKNIPLSVHKAAQVIGIHATTLTSYIELGYIKTTNEGHIMMLDALRFDYQKAKQKLLDRKIRIKNRR